MRLKSIITSTVLAGAILSLASCNLVSEKSVNDSDAVTSSLYLDGITTKFTELDSRIEAHEDFQVQMQYEYLGYVSGAKYDEKAEESTYVDFDNNVINHVKKGTLNDKKYESKLSVYIEGSLTYVYFYESLDGEEKESTTAVDYKFDEYVNYILSAEIQTLNPLSFNFYSMSAKYYISDNNMYTIKISDYVLQYIYGSDEWTAYSRYPNGESQLKFDFKEQNENKLN